MSKPLPASPPGVATVRAELHEVALLLRAARHLAPPVQQELADLLEELSRALNAVASPSGEMLHVAQTATHLAQNLHKQDEQKSLLVAAKENLQRAIARAEAEAPQVTQLVGRIVDALASIGI